MQIDMNQLADLCKRAEIEPRFVTEKSEYAGLIFYYDLREVEPTTSLPYKGGMAEFIPFLFARIAQKEFGLQDLTGIPPSHQLADKTEVADESH